MTRRNYIVPVSTVVEIEAEVLMSQSPTGKTSRGDIVSRGDEYEEDIEADVRELESWEEEW